MKIALELELLEGEYAIALLPPDQAVPDWVRGPGFVNLSFCNDELSVVARQDRMPANVRTDTGWRAIKLAGSFDFDQAGIVLSVVRPVSEGGFAVFVVSTFYRDYVLVRSADFEHVSRRLVDVGHRFFEHARPRA